MRSRPRRTSPSRAPPCVRQLQTPRLHEAQESVRMDDNGVDIMEQSVELARNGYQLQYVMSAISGELSLLRTAIRG